MELLASADTGRIFLPAYPGTFLWLTASLLRHSNIAILHCSNAPALLHAERNKPDKLSLKCTNF